MVQFASYLRRVLCKKRLIFPRINGPNEPFQVTLPRFSNCVPVPVIRGLTSFLTMAEVAVWQVFMKRAKEANVIAERISLDVGFRELKNAL